MTYDLRIDNNPHRIELEPLAHGAFRVVLNGVVRQAHVEVLPGGVYSLIVEGVHYQIDLEDSPDGMAVEVRGQSYQVEVIDPRKSGGASRLGGGSGSAVLKSPMPGKVIKLLVGEGDEVARGAGVVIVEAMKMQNELKAPRAGRISGIFVAEGATVENGTRLLSIE